MRLALLAAFSLVTACDNATPGDLPPGNTEIGRAAPQGALPSCSRARYCGQIGYVDCGAAVDGSANLFHRREDRIISACGGA